MARRRTLNDSDPTATQRPQRVVTLFLAALGVVLIGYAFLSRGFAHIGVPPIYVGEAVVALGLLGLLTGLPAAISTSPAIWFIGLFAAWGAIRTFPYVGLYGVDALRDAVLWGYSLLAVFVAAALVRTRLLSRGLATYRRLVPWFLAWVPIYFVVARTVNPDQSDDASLLSTFFTFKAGDFAVHLAGIAALGLLGLAGAQRSRRAKSWLVTLWIAAFVLTACVNRGGMMAVGAAMLTLLLFKPADVVRRGLRAIRPAIAPVMLVAGISGLAGPVLGVAPIVVGDIDQRQVSLLQFFDNARSLVSRGSAPGLDETRDWRLEWWTVIGDYTLRGPYFWTGKGFGINLAEDDDFQVGADDSLRSPHNGHLNVLARTGVPGAVLWLALLASFAGTMVFGYRRSSRAGMTRLAAVHVWILSYWVASAVNAAFDVYLEGPQGGIWFWSLVGAGVAVACMSRVAPQAEHHRSWATNEMSPKILPVAPPA